MKTLKLSCILCIVLAFLWFNANAQKPIVINHDEWVWGIDPSPDLPCLTERIEGMIVMDGFWTNSSNEVAVYNYVYHEKGVGTLTGKTTGEYECVWNFNGKEMSFDSGFPKHSTGGAHTNITKNGLLFMTINWNYHFIWNEPWTYPIVWREAFNPKCK
jgi:hypothetical protein